MFNAAEIERIIDGIAEASEEVLARSRLGRTLAEAAAPEGILEVRRLWREIDVAMGPGKSVVETLLARYRRLGKSLDRMAGLARQGERVTAGAARNVVLAEMDAELKAFASIKRDVISRTEQSVSSIRSQLEAEFAADAGRLGRRLSSAQVRAECAKALDELEGVLRTQRDSFARGVESRLTAAAAKKRTEAIVAQVVDSTQSGERAAIGYRIKRFAAHNNASEVTAEFGKRVKRTLRKALPMIDEIEDSSLMFMEILGAVESTQPEMARLVRRYAEQGAATLTKKELERVNGILGQLLGLMPEEVAMQMKFCEGLFHKAAFEVLADIPPHLRGQIGVELVQGPLWVLSPSGPARQFGDGSMLLTGPNGQSVLIGLGEMKAGFDKNLLEQLFQRSDKRAIDATVSFIDSQGKVQTRRLTREIRFPGSDEAARIRKPPIYVHAAPGGQAADTAEKFEEMLRDHMRSGRELLKIQLPFEASANARFADESLKEAVRIMKKLDKNWGRPLRGK